MTDEISPLIQVASKVAGPLISFVGKEIFKRLTDDSATSRAIATTCEAFEEIEGLQSVLTTWCQSEDFWVLIEKLHEGDRQLTDIDLAAKFVSLTGFYMADDTDSVTEDVLQEFWRNLEHELYIATGGVGRILATGSPRPAGSGRLVPNQRRHGPRAPVLPLHRTQPNAAGSLGPGHSSGRRRGWSGRWLVPH